MATLEELEARVAALEADRGDYRAVLAAVNALGLKVAGHQTEARERFDVLDGRLETLENGQAELRTSARSLEDNLAEVKDLLVRALDR